VIKTLRLNFLMKKSHTVNLTIYSLEISRDRKMKLQLRSKLTNDRRTIVRKFTN